MIYKNMGPNAVKEEQMLNKDYGDATGIAQILRPLTSLTPCLPKRNNSLGRMA